jgi:hypothetical protein
LSLGPHSANSARNVAEAPKAKLALYGRLGPLEVWLVRGRFIRDRIFIDFTTGGNSQVYKWMPKNEIWLDDAMQEEAGPVILHELTEYNAMLAGKDYDAAHELANVNELAAREHPEKIGELFAEELAKLEDSQDAN